MKVQLHHPNREQGFTIIAYLIFSLVIMGTIAAVASYVIQNVNYGKRRQDFVNAYQFAQGGAVIACRDIETAFTNNIDFLTSLRQSCCGTYITNSSESSATQLILDRTIAPPFTNQTVAVKLRMTNNSAPDSIDVLATATVGNSSQTVEIHVDVQFAFGAAIISTAQGNASTSVSKSCAQAGNVVVSGSSGNVTLVDGGVLSNGAANTDDSTVDLVSRDLYGTSHQIPDYTSPGSSDQLFDFNRFIAVATASGQHYTNLTQLIAMGKSNTLEGVVAVDIKYGEGQGLDSKDFPNGINVRGTLLFNFCPNSKGQNWDPLDKIVNTATMNINAANLSGFNPTNNATNAIVYPSGYPPVYSNTNKNPVNVNIAPAFQNFTVADDLPAFMYNNAILDMHGNVNICGVVYSSSFMEIENKQSGQTQYFNGALIGGGGIYVENGQKATTVVRFDPNALDRLATSGKRGKLVMVRYQR